MLTRRYGQIKAVLLLRFFNLDTSINGLLLAGSRVFGGLWLPIFAWSELASAEWLALGI